MEFKVYLAGPITGLAYGEAVDWREYAKERLRGFGIAGYSPMRGKAYLSKEDKLADSYNDQTMSSIVGINVRDYNDCKTSDAILVNFLGSQKVSIGTVMEVAWARAFDIPVVMVIEPGNVHEHGMLTYGCITVPTIYEGVLAIAQILIDG